MYKKKMHKHLHLPDSKSLPLAQMTKLEMLHMHVKFHWQISGCLCTTTAATMRLNAFSTEIKSRTVTKAFQITC
jgi:hypothetical protein